MEAIKTDASKRWVVTGTNNIEKLGVHQGNPSAHAWDQLQEEFRVRAVDEEQMERCVHNLISKVQGSASRRVGRTH